MAETATKLGRVSLVPRGAYSASATYNRLDIVEYEGSSYLVLADGTAGVTPAVGESYMMVAKKGDKGDTGATGATGETGSPGASGSPGSDGEDGVGIQSIARTGGDGSPGTTDTYTITLTDGTTSTFTVYNGADGTSFTVLGRYDTLAELKAAHPTGSEGDAWAVGSAEDNDIYLWDVDTAAWTNIGSLQGPPGHPGQDGANGVTFTPAVSEAGVLSFTNDGGLPNPDPVNIKGEPGTPGGNGDPGTDGKTAYQYAVDGGYTGTEAEFQALMGSGPWLPVAGGVMTGKITGVVTPEADADAANKAYVDSKAGNVKAGNVNLLDNWYFPDPVNQRGLTHYVGEGHIYEMYSVDRFQIYNGVSCDLVSGGLKFTFPGYSDAGNYIFGHPLENVPGLRGKTVTLSMLVTDYTGGEQGVWLFGKFHNDYHNSFASSTLQGTGLYSATFLVPDDAEVILVGIGSPLIPVTITVMAVKLELGSQQTLAHQNADGSWVLNDPPPNKALELEKCQRYQYVANSLYYAAGAVSGSGVNIGVNFPCTMRITPTMQDKTGVTGDFFTNALMRSYGNLTARFGNGSPTSCSIVFSNPDTSVFEIGRQVTATVYAPLLFDANL